MSRSSVVVAPNLGIQNALQNVVFVLSSFAVKINFVLSFQSSDNSSDEKRERFGCHNSISHLTLSAVTTGICLGLLKSREAAQKGTRKNGTFLQKAGRILDPYLPAQPRCHQKKKWSQTTTVVCLHTYCTYIHTTKHQFLPITTPGMWTSWWATEEPTHSRHRLR